MKVLFTSPILEHPAAGGPQLRIENSIKALSRVCELHIAARVRREMLGDAGAEDYYRGHCSSFWYLPSARHASSNRPVRIARRLLNKVLGTDARRDAKEIVAYAREQGIGVIWFGYGNISFDLIRRVKQIAPTLRVVCDTDSVWSRFVLRELPLVRSASRRARIWWTGKRKEREERAWVRLCDITTAVSEVDAKYYRELAADRDRVHIFSNVIDLDSYRTPPSPALGMKQPSIYLAGSFGHENSPMDVAARWVLSEILPRVKAEIPEVHFFIVGRNSDKTLGHLAGDGVTVTGKVASVLPYLCHANVAMVPLKFESGTRFKILEAGACGVPVVSTVLGAEGLSVRDGEHVLLADDAAQFASAIVRLIRDKDLASRLTHNCRDLVRAQYSVEQLAREAEHILGAIGHV